VKSSQRLDYSSLAEVLGQRGLVEPQALKLALQSSARGPIPFPEALVNENLMGDWDLSRVVCDLYGLAFLPIGIYEPAPEALHGLDTDFLRQHRLVPLARHGQVITVCMPALVQADVLGMLAASADLHVLPVVGSVLTNARWIEENLAAAAARPSDLQSNWSNIFDEGDAAVLMDLSPAEGGDPSSSTERPAAPR